MRAALFAPCFVDQLAPGVAIAAVQLLERLGVEVALPGGAACCGQPPANAGDARSGDAALRLLVETFAPFTHTIVLSGSCTTHVRQHAAQVARLGGPVAQRTYEFCEFLHDVIGLDRLRALAASDTRCVAVHIGCHALRGLQLATPSERMLPAMDKVRAVLGTVRGLSFAPLQRPDECCGFGGSFSVGEPAVSARMGRDRLDDIGASGADAVVSTDVSCMLHLSAIGRAAGRTLPMLHVAQLLATASGIGGA
ncbi:MAG: (Fe-S)-binding protein [Gemmatimonadaceae bacterium]|nr:(Fe-S)-binding protein [Gemmatimonadaceae bacterium]